jgi:diguanylate cyclase (GGDEF)-like protein/PAS domain S-box-containing protein
VQCLDGRQFKITLVLPDKLSNSEAPPPLESAFNLIDSNLWIHQLLSQLPITVLCLDRDGKLITAQGQLVELLGLTQNSLGKLAIEIKTLMPFRETMQQGLAGETLNKIVIYKAIALETIYQPLLEAGKWMGCLMILHDITPRRLCQMRLRNAQSELALIMPYMKAALIYTEGEKIIRVNPACCELLGYSEAELLTLSLTQLHPDFHTHLQLQASPQHKKSQAPYRMEQKILTKTDSWVTCMLTLRLLPPRRSLWLLEKIEIKAVDIGNFPMLAPATPSIPLYLQEVWHEIPTALLFLDQDLCMQQGNRALERLTGYSMEQLRHKPLQSLDKNDDDCAFYQELQQHLRQQQHYEVSLEQRHQQGKIYGCHLKISTHWDAEQRVNYFAVLQTLSESLLFDPLTGLPLRSLFDFNLQKTLARAQRHQKNFAVLLVSVENLSKIQQQFGYQVGDNALQLLGNMLKATVRDSDTVAWGGRHQFVVLLEEIAQAKDAGLVGQMILFKLTQPLKLAGYEVYAEVNIGIAIYPEDHLDAEYLVQLAEIALERAEKQGRGGQCCFYNPTLQE